MLQMNFWNQVGHDLDLWKLFRALQNFAAASLQLAEQLVEIQPLIHGPIIFQIAAATEVQFLRAANVAVAKVVQADGDLNQPLIEPPRGSLRVGPQLFPHFVRLVKVALIEVLNPIQIARIIGGLGHGIRSPLPTLWLRPTPLGPAPWSECPPESAARACHL